MKFLESFGQKFCKIKYLRTKTNVNNIEMEYT
jgi:hypothetical protein